VEPPPFDGQSLDGENGLTAASRTGSRRSYDGRNSITGEAGSSFALSTSSGAKGGDVASIGGEAGTICKVRRKDG